MPTYATKVAQRSPDTCFQHLSIIDDNNASQFPINAPNIPLNRSVFSHKFCQRGIKTQTRTDSEAGF
nr:MAG TPA: hypothetical protein [Caudoviricetes sp.]